MTFRKLALIQKIDLSMLPGTQSYVSPPQTMVRLHRATSFCELAN